MASSWAAAGEAGGAAVVVTATEDTDEAEEAGQRRRGQKKVPAVALACVEQCSWLQSASSIKYFIYSVVCV